MKNVCLLLMLAYSSVAFAQGACDAKIDNKSYTVKLVAKGGDKKDIKGKANDNSFAYEVTIKNTSKIKLDFEPALWGMKDGKPALLGKANKKTAGPGSSISIPGNIKGQTLDEVKVTVTKTDCKDAGKNSYTDPAFYKAGM